MKNILNKIKLEATALELPIIMDDMEFFLYDLVQKSAPKLALEIGTANGFSASVILSADNKVKLTTIEKDETRFKLAKKNLKSFKKRVTSLFDDALNVLQNLVTQPEKFDFVFMDGPKAQYITYLPYILKLLSANGILVCDNIFFHGMVNGTVETPKSIKTLVAKLKDFLETVTTLEGYTYQILNIADGVLVLTKNK